MVPTKKAQKDAGGAPHCNTNASKHNLHRAKRALRELGINAIDGRTRVGRALNAWRAEVARDLGGELSATQTALLELACRQKLLVDSIDSWLLQQPSLINKRKRSLLPVVGQRQSLANALEQYLSRLGYERRARPVASAITLVHRETNDDASGGGGVIDVR